MRGTFWSIAMTIGVGGAFLSGIALPNNREGAPPNRSLVEGPAYWATNSGSSGARCSTPNDTGAASRTNPRTAVDRASASSSAASPSERICEARADSCRPASVNAIRREVRLNSRVLSFASTRLTAFETVAFERLSSAAAAANPLQLGRRLPGLRDRAAWTCQNGKRLISIISIFKRASGV